MGCMNRSEVPLPLQIEAEITDEDLDVFVQEMYSKARKNPLSALHRGRLGMTYHANSFRAEAIRTYEQASELDDANALWPYLNALVHVENGNAVEALSLIEQSLKQDPLYIPAKLQRAQFLLDLGHFEKAEIELQSVIDLNPEDPYTVSAQTVMARLYRSTGRIEQAIEILEPLVEQYGHPYLIRLLGRTYRDAGKTEQSRHLLTEKDDPQTLDWPDPRADRIKRYVRGFTKRLLAAEQFIEQGRISDALSILEALIELKPEDTAVINNLGIAYRLEGRIDDSSRLLKRGLAVEKLDHLILFNLAVNYEVQEQSEKALTHYRKAVAANPGLLPAYERMANLLIEDEEFEAAIKVLQDSLVHAEENSSTHYLIGLVHGMLGRWQESAKELRRAAELAPDDEAIWVKLALSLTQLGDINGAYTAIERAESLNSNTPTLTEAKQIIEATANQISR